MANIAYDNGILEEAAYLGLRNNLVLEIKETQPAQRQNWRQMINNHPDLQNLDVVKLIDAELQKHE